MFIKCLYSMISNHDCKLRKSCWASILVAYAINWEGIKIEWLSIWQEIVRNCGLMVA